LTPPPPLGICKLHFTKTGIYCNAFYGEICLDGDQKYIVQTGFDAEDKALTETFYRVAAIEQFCPAKYGMNIGDDPCRLYTQENKVVVNVPLVTLEAITEAYHQFGNPLYGKTIDLRPENQEQVTDDFKNKTGLFAHLKQTQHLVT
jgi:hypothetical protein